MDLKDTLQCPPSCSILHWFSAFCISVIRLVGINFVTFNFVSMAMQRNYFTILFFIKKSKLLKNGEAPICMRITVNGQRAEIQIKRSVEVSKWNSQKECTAYKPQNEMRWYFKSFCGRITFISTWKSHSTLTLLATQNYPFLLKYDCPLWLK